MFMTLSIDSQASTNNECPQLFSATKVKPLANKAWRHADGPTSKERRQYSHRRFCHLPGKKNKIIYTWKKAKRVNADVRKRKTLKSKCGNNSLEEVNSCIDYASIYEGGADRNWMHRIAQCESTKNPRAQNPSGAGGLYQFLASTWNTISVRNHSRYSAKWASLGAAEMYRAGRQGEWVCN